MKIVPKNIFDSIRIIDECVNIFIADDEKYFLKAASKSLADNFNVYTFDNAEELLKKATNVGENSFFFVDRNLGENKADEAYSLLRSNGLKDIFNISEDSDFFHSDAIKMRKKEIINFLT